MPGGMYMLFKERQVGSHQRQVASLFLPTIISIIKKGGNEKMMITILAFSTIVMTKNDRNGFAVDK